MKVGIDLGTTYSLISKWQANGSSLLIPDFSFKDSFATPSIAHIASGTAVVGYLVDILLEQNPDLSVIRFFKRHFGNDKPIFFDSSGNAWYPESVGALILKKLRFDAENFTGETLESAVITVPAHFNDLQRKSVLNAAYLADIPILGLVEEPVAAALHYGITSQRNGQIIMVYDLGGGTFDASILSLDKKGVYVLSKEGITNLGGKEFDEKIGEYILKQFEKTPLGIPDLNAFALLQLRRISEEVKIELSMPNVTFLRKKILLGNQTVDVIFNRHDFENSIRNAVEKTIEATIRCIDGAGISIKDIDAMLLVGGSSMIPFIKERLSTLLPESKQKLFFHEPMKAVSFGASIRAMQLSGESKAFNLPPEFRGVTGQYLGVRIIDPHTNKVSIDVLVKKNMPLPIKVTRTYFTSNSNQNRIVIELVQYLEKQEDAISIGHLVVGPLPNPKINYPIEVSIENTEDGLVLVNAYDPNTGIVLEQSFGNQEQGTNYLLEQRKLVKNTLINNLY
jgi:molecular chaperone DnaK